MAYKVGVNVIEGVGVSPISGVSTSISGIMGNFEKGPINVATLVTDMASFERIFGANPITESVCYYAVKAFFKKVGTSQLYIVRVVSSSAAKATVNLDDQQTSPDPTLQVDALSEGDWGENISVDIDANSIVATTLVSDLSVAAVEAVLVSVEGIEVGSYVKIDDTTNTEYVEVTQIDVAAKKIYWSGGLTYGYTAAASTIVTLEFTLKVYWKGVLVETWAGLTMHDTPTFYCEKVINGNSLYISVTDLDSTAGDYEELPDVLSSPTALLSGNDGLSTISETDYEGVESDKTGVYAFDDIQGLFRFCVSDPYIASSDEAKIITVMQACLDYCNTQGMIEFYGDIPNSKSASAAVTFAGNFAGRQMSLWYPYGKILVNGQYKEVPLSSVCMAAAVLKDYTRGIHKNVGNETIPYYTDLKLNVSVAEGETLNDAGINTVRKFTGQGIKTYGGRTQSPVTAWRFLNHSEYFNYVGRTLQSNLIDVPFEPNSTALWKTVLRRVNAFMDGEIRKGAITAYSAIMDGTNNLPDDVALGIATLELEYVPVGVAEKFVVRLTSSPAGLSVTTS